ncbi:MAG: SGNH/GDSL hydrolase family protein [Betaproteobacteria bacterium]
MNSLRKHLIDACIVVTVTLVALVALEYAARLASAAHGKFFKRTNPVIARQDWGRQYQEDESNLTYNYAAYVGFRAGPLSSPTINIDDQGRRRVPGNCERDGRTTIWTFGGSTMFGYGSPDEGTIPAHLARLLNGKGRCTRIVNFGSGNWQSSQGVVQLTRELARGSRPDAVVFYDGINDTSVVLDNTNPGDMASGSESILSNAFAKPPRILYHVAHQSVLVRILRNSVLAPIADIVSQGRSSDRSTSALAIATAGVYAENMRMVDALAHQYAFGAYFFLQPQLLTSGKTLTKVERAVRDADPHWQEEALLYRDFYAAYRSHVYLASNPRFFDISRIFEGMSEEIVADPEHLLPEGNRIVAERIAREIGSGTTARVGMK